MGKQSKSVIGCFSFACLFRSQLFFSTPLTNIQGLTSLPWRNLMNVPGLFNFLSKPWQQKTQFLSSGCGSLGSSFAKAKLKVIYGISNTIIANELHISSEDLHPSFPPPFCSGLSLFCSTWVNHPHSLVKEQDITFSVLNDKKTFLGRCQSGTAESQRPAK